VKLTYRPEIDGLRAIAVGAVIFYHAQTTILGYQAFEGGFIGVDIFFVISGYLITLIILKELVTTGTFSFKHFYERRIRRILPALLFVMLVSLPFAWMYLLPSNLIDFSKSILYSLGFSSNFYFHYSGQQYGAQSGLLKPFLHTWSLSVEEQYYILFPIVLLITFKYFRKFLLTVIIIGFITSLQMADWGSRNYTSATFYFLNTRMWELLAGSILAYLEISKGHRSQNKTLNLILPSIGLFLIAHSILSFNEEMFHPSFRTLTPVIGTCLIIWFSEKDELITKILSTKSLVGIGLISYSLYLWHYPFFAFDRLIEFTEGNLFKKSLLLITILISSIFSFYFIERPARNNKKNFKAIISFILISIFILVVYNFNILQKEGYKNRVSEIVRQNFSDISQRPWILLKNSDGSYCHDNINACKFNTSSNKKVYVVGDSIMGALIFDLKDKVIKNNYQFITMTAGACLYFPGFNQVQVTTQKKLDCNNIYFQKIKKILKNENNSIIIFGGRWPLYLTNKFHNIGEGRFELRFVSSGKHKTIQSSFKNEVIELSRNNKIILVYPIPEAYVYVSNKLNIYLNSLPKNVNKKKISIKDYFTSSYEVYRERTKTSFELLNSIKGKNIYKVYPHELFCNTVIKERCLTHDDRNLFYHDWSHPSKKGADMINNLIMKEIKKIELAP